MRPAVLARLVAFASIAGFATRPAEAAPIEVMEPFAYKVVRAAEKHPRVILAPRTSSRAVLRIQFRAGNFDDGHRPGLTKLTQHAMLSANSEVDYKDFRLAVFAAAAKLEIETGVRESAITLTAPTRAFEGLARRLLSMCLDPDIDPEKLDDARSRALQSEQKTNAGGMISMLARAVLSEPGHGDDPEGDLDSIQVLEARDVERHLAGPLSPANATVIVAGRFDTKRLSRLLARYSGGVRKESVRPRDELAGTYHLKGPLEVELVAYPLRLTSPRAMAAAHLAAALLGDRVQWQFRRMGIAYSTLTEPVHHAWLDGLVIVLPTRPENSQEPAALLAETVEKVRTGAFTEEELEESRRALMAHFHEVDRDPRALAQALGIGTRSVPWLSPAVMGELSRMTKMELTETVRADMVSSRAIRVRLSPDAPAEQPRRTP